ncbi:MAG TPA: hypothetical protein PKY35_04910 [Candidatus Hydrogenedentes bacterium]|nr:hypothetical protein [Candidatus Hydrogenedentota bacterium]HOL76350.1 hypothetical protein [Candidatus Hydrogenedentota bacterium]HPO85388.1 hypothetical protein [Candidatus Hydrogenedentota bacterium]
MSCYIIPRAPLSPGVLVAIGRNPAGTTWQSPLDFGDDHALGPLALRLPRCHCEECRQARRGNPLGISGMTMPWVLLRYAVEGIASSLRRLAPRNDNWGDIKPNGIG